MILTVLTWLAAALLVMAGLIVAIILALAIVFGSRELYLAIKGETFNDLRQH